MNNPPESIRLERADRRAWIGLFVVVTAVLMVVADASIVNVAFPELEESLNTDKAVLSWIISGYNVTVASFLLLAGRIADRYGRRRAFELGVIIFTLSSLACGLAPNAQALVGFRVLQAIGGSTIFPASLALVLPSFPAHQRPTAIGLWGAMGGVGATIGPALGGILTQVSWRAIFLVNIPIGLGILFFSRRIFKESRDTARVGKLDALGVPAGTLGIALIMIALVQGQDWGYSSGLVVIMFILGLAFIPLAIYRSATHASPLLDLSLFKVKSFLIATLSVSCFGMAFLAGFLLNSILIQELWGWSVLTSGLALSIPALISALVALGSGPLAKERGHREVLFAGSLLSCLSFVHLLLFAGSEANFWGVYLPSGALLGVGVGLSIASFTSGSLRDIVPELFAIGNATARTAQQLSYALGVTVVIILVGENALIGDFQRGWIWVAGFYFAACLVAVFWYPSRFLGLNKDANSNLEA